MKHQSFLVESRSPDKHRGFTLLQLVVVIGIIGVLAALVFGSLNRGRATRPRAQHPPASAHPCSYIFDALCICPEYGRIRPYSVLRYH